MAISSAYATATEYKSFIDKTISTEDAELDEQLDGTSRYLEGVSNSFWNIDAAVVVRQLLGAGLPCLDLGQGNAPGIATQTGLIIKVDQDNDGDFTDETALDNATLRFLPLDADVGPEARPWRFVELTSRSGLGSFPSNHLVQVTAKWGWPAVPKLVKQTTIELTAIWRGEGSRASQRMNELDEAISASPYAMSLVKKFISRYQRLVVV